MRDAAYLLATLEQLKKVTAIINTELVELNSQHYFKYLTVDKETNAHSTNIYPAATLASELLYDWSEVPNRVNCYKHIHSLKIPFKSHLDYCCFLCLKEATAKKIDYAEIIDDQLTYRQGIKKTQVPITSNIDTVLGAEGILDGLIINDYAGSHYTVVTPGKKQHLTTSTNCSCLEFSQTRRCSHIKVISLLPQYRQLLISLGLLRIKF